MTCTLIRLSSISKEGTNTLGRYPDGLIMTIKHLETVMRTEDIQSIDKET